jgi:hypothetical protein
MLFMVKFRAKFVFCSKIYLVDLFISNFFNSFATNLGEKLPEEARFLNHDGAGAGV